MFKNKIKRKGFEFKPCYIILNQDLVVTYKKPVGLFYLLFIKILFLIWKEII